MTEITRFKILKRIIDALLASEIGVSKDKILDIYASHDGGKVPSEKTFERIKNRIKNELFFELKYNRATNNYYVDKDVEGYQENIAHFLQFSEVFTLLEIYSDGKTNYKNFNNYLIPEERSYFNSNHLIAPLLKAINLGVQISFTKDNFLTEKKKVYTVSPLRLKEYLKRWYLVSVPLDGNDIRTIGLDRIHDLTILNDKTKANKTHVEQLKNYDCIVGLNYQADGFNDVEDIVLEVKNIQIKYLQSLKLHHSQQCFYNENGTWGTVTYTLKPNYEFVSQILKMGVNVRVLKPEILKDDVARNIKEMWGFYK